MVGTDGASPPTTLQPDRDDEAAHRGHQDAEQQEPQHAAATVQPAYLRRPPLGRARRTALPRLRWRHANTAATGTEPDDEPETVRTSSVTTNDRAERHRTPAPAALSSAPAAPSAGHGRARDHFAGGVPDVDCERRRGDQGRDVDQQQCGGANHRALAIRRPPPLVAARAG